MRDLLFKIKKAKELIEHLKHSMLIGSFNEGLTEAVELEFPYEYLSLLKTSNGFTAGEIILFSSHELLEEKWRIEYLEEYFEGKWFYFGKVNDNMLVYDLSNKTYHLFSNETPKREILRFNSLEIFLREFVFGDRYLEITDDSFWYDFISENNLKN